MTHKSIWNIIDRVAMWNGLSRSGLARACNLDATSFNYSKRWSAYGQPRWPSGLTISRVIAYSGLSDAEFFDAFGSDNGKKAKN